MRLVVRAAVLVLVAAPASASAGEKAKATLAYARVDAAESRCPDEATFRGLVSARLGYDPFVESGDLALSVEFRPEGSALAGQVRLQSAGTGRRGERTIRSGETDCSELSTSVSLAVALALDPDAVRARAPVEEPLEIPDPTPPLTPPAPLEPARRPPVADRSTPVTPPEEEGVALGARIDVTGGFAVGVVPAVSFGFRGGVALDAGLWTLGAEGAAILPRGEATQFGEVSASVAYGSLVPCARPSVAFMYFDLCVAGSVGAMFSEARSVTRSFPTTDVYAAIGPRVGVTAMFLPAVGAAIALDVPIALSRVHLVIEDDGREREAWASPPVGFMGGLSAVFRLR